MRPEQVYFTGAEMGPSIILDKSAYQSLSKYDIFELSRYFYVVIPPVLILEILADLKKPKFTPDRAKAEVRKLARKISRFDSKVNLGYRSLCVANLMGERVEMGRRPIIAPGHRITTQDGKVGMWFDVPPGIEALSRWSRGEFDEAEQLLATRWRESSKAIDLEAFKRQVCHQDRVPLGSLALVRRVTDDLMKEPDAQLVAINYLVQELGMVPEVGEWTQQRWKSGGFTLVSEFAPYAGHCIKVNMIFQLALVNDLIGTRSTNRINMEYYFYSPFACIFCSGDNLHRKLAEHVLESDQSFVWHDDLRSALRQVAEARRQAKESGAGDFHRLEPEPNSLIRKLWAKHNWRWEARRGHEPISEERNRELMDELKPLIDAINNAKEDSPPPPRWPCP